MSEEKQKQKVKSTLSVDVPPFIPRNFNLELLDNTIPPVSGISNISPYLQDEIHIEESEWHPPTSSRIMLFPVTPVLHPSYRLQSSSRNDRFYEASHLQPDTNNYPSHRKKVQNQKNLQRKPIPTFEEVDDSNSFSCVAPSKNERKPKERHVKNDHQKPPHQSNSKIKVKEEKNNTDKMKPQLKLSTIHSTLNHPMKLDNSTDFPSLPSALNKDNSHNQLHNDNHHQSPQHHSYSSILQSTPKQGSDLNQKLVAPNNDNRALMTFREKRTFCDDTRTKQNLRRKPEAKEKHNNVYSENSCEIDSEVENKQNGNSNGIKNQINSKYQNHAEKVVTNSKTIKPGTKERNIILKNKSLESNVENTKVRETSTELVTPIKDGSTTANQPTKPHKNEKRRKRNKKKKKVDPGKVSLLTPEMFTTITNKLNGATKLDDQNSNFNLSDQDFPNLNHSSSKHVVEESEERNVKIGDFKQDKICLNNISNNNNLPDLDFSNLWRSSTYSDILQSANKVRNNNKGSQSSMGSINKKSTDNINEEQKSMLATASKKKAKKKKNKTKNASRCKKQIQQADSNKQVESVPVIQVSIASMVTSMQQIKLSQKKKKETKTRVISTKRGIMDKMANPHNILDSSAPMKKRGKEREKPCIKRLSAMRKVILRERERRRMQRLEESCKNENDDTIKELDETNADITPSTHSPVDEHVMSTENHCEQVDRKLLAAKIILHTKKFRDYCDHMVSEEIDTTAMTILKDLVRFQDRLHEKDPIKARMKRRLVYGLREVTKHLRLCKLKCIIIAPNIEKISSEGGLSDALQIIIKLAQEQDLPYIFALQRRLLGKICMKVVPVSCVGIFNYEGVEENYRKLLQFLTEAREKYNETLKVITTYLTDDIESRLLDENIPPTLIQPIRLEVLSKMSIHSVISERIPSEKTSLEENNNNTEEFNTDNDFECMLQKMENISEESQEEFVEKEESLTEIDHELSLVTV